jgi:hypothetical protein
MIGLTLWLGNGPMISFPTTSTGGVGKVGKKTSIITPPPHLLWGAGCGVEAAKPENAGGESGVAEAYPQMQAGYRFWAIERSHTSCPCPVSPVDNGGITESCSTSPWVGL